MLARITRNSRAAVVVFAALAVATLVSWWLGIDEGGAPGEGASVGTAAVIVIAFVKVRLVGRHFMELRDAPAVMRIVLDAYVVVVCAALIAIYVATT
ncbi:hypothetical protein DSM112329_01984 [Paraconexibacter sp. AEG42_29]|uniref:Prokaryotic cytochrome C oxidase subunit IV family protein n=1 Tax=Paraconexibacter sp. AEG42_29 TaxID=2997339 RepID=A0AAU7AU12_9ACTN